MMPFLYGSMTGAPEYREGEACHPPYATRVLLAMQRSTLTARRTDNDNVSR
jgi:hypothetical protein